MKLIFSAFVLALFTTISSFSSYPERFEGLFPEYRDKPLDLIEKFLPADPVIFEAGGHYGTETETFAKKWPKSTIISFEPNPAAFDKLCNVAKNYPNIFPYQLAVGHSNALLPFYICYGSTGDNPIYEGASSLLPPSDYMKIHYQGPTIIVQCVRLEDWLLENNVEQIDFMWLDLEGNEFQALMGMGNKLDQVAAIFIETNFQEFRQGMTQYKYLKGFLERKGFRLLSHWYAEGMQGNAIFIK